jgi:5-methylcytosine-specific restriction endonuclease McrA
MAKRLKYGRDIVWVNHKRKKFSKSEREFIFKRDNFTCQLCEKDLYLHPNKRVLDHKIPLSQFGTNDLTNIWLLCDDCDMKKKSEILPSVIKDRILELQHKTKMKYKI